MIVLFNLFGILFEFDFVGCILMIEEVDEVMYWIDCILFYVIFSMNVCCCVGIMFGCCVLILLNMFDFGMDEEVVVWYWCDVLGICWLGCVDIGYDVVNMVVLFG